MARVLLVDDDPDILELLSLVLGVEHVVTAVASGMEALDRVTGEQFDLLILDAMMPTMDGYALLRRVRSGGRMSDVPVIMLTARTGEADHLRGFEEGADAYATKPFDPEGLTRVVDEVLARRPDERARVRAEEIARARLLGTIERRFEM